MPVLTYPAAVVALTMGNYHLKKDIIFSFGFKLKGETPSSIQSSLPSDPSPSRSIHFGDVSEAVRKAIFSPQV